MASKNVSSSSAFTIVELLVVIVVIGILATITIVSYSGISQKAIITSLKSDLGNASRLLKMYQVINSAYPATLQLANDGKGVPASSGTSYQYIFDNRSNPQGFCIAAIKNSTIYNITNEGQSAIGDCQNYKLALGLDSGDVLSYSGSGNLWNDLSTGGNDISLMNTVNYNSQNGGVLIFDGINDYGITSNNFIVNPTSLTISSWFSKTSSNSTYNCVLHKGSDSSIGQSEYWLGVEYTGKLTATIGAISGVGWSAGQTGIDATLGSWWNLVATWDGSIVRVYVNGQFNKQYNLSAYSSINYPTRIGASSDGTAYQFPGLISTVNIFNRALSADEILQNFNATKTRYGL